MKRIKKVCAILLSALSCFMCACNNSDNNSEKSSNSKVPDATSTTQDYLGQPEFGGGLHKVTVTDSTRQFVDQNGKSEYQIVAGTDSYALKSVLFMQDHIQQATGVEIPIAYGVETWDENKKYIVIGRDDLFAQAGLSMPKDSLGYSGYYIKTVGNSVFIATEHSYGYQQAAISFLTHLIGYEAYSATMIGYSKKGSTMPNMEIIERPDFDLRLSGYRDPIDQGYSMGFNPLTDVVIAVEGETWHTVLNFLPPSEYAAEHDEWYDSTQQQLCYTAHGDEEELELMIQTVADKTIALIEQNPGVPIVTFSIEDVPIDCRCDGCTIELEKYGCASASLIKFLNRVDDIVQAYLEDNKENGKKREFYIAFFAYFQYDTAPVKEVNGEYVLIDEEVKLNEHVVPFFIPIWSNWYEDFTHDSNENAYTNLQQWGAIADKIIYWFYGTGFHTAFFPFNDYDVLVDNYRLAAEQSTFLMRNEAVWFNDNGPHFSKLEQYKESKVTFNVNVNQEEVINDFFQGYYREGASAMRKYYDQMTSYLEYCQVAYPGAFTGNIYAPIEDAKYWPKQTLLTWLNLTEEALKAVEIHKESNPELYQKLVDNITLETIFPRYLLVTSYASTYSSDILRQMRIEFKEDLTYFGISKITTAGMVEVSSLYSDWGI